MKEKKPRTRSTPRAAAPSPGVAVLAAVLAQLDGVGAALRRFLGDAPAPAERTPWKRFYPAAARAAADMMDLEPPLFTWLPFAAESLRTLEREVFHLGEIRSFLASLLEIVDELLAGRKDDLAQRTTAILTGLAAAQGSPLTPPEVRERLAKLGKAVLDLVEEHNAAAIEKRQRTIKLRDTVDQLSSENQQLRDEIAAEDDAAPRLAAARRSRRAPR